ncbi:MAG TPA: glycosyltransferase family 4 protein [Bryobacteraceae bacterium]|nr:glycosyltransferase family 4 protein [Bryobacteraceae bacterium]
MRVAFLNPTGQIGGAETSLLGILGSIRETYPHWELHLIAGSDGPLLKEAAGLGVSCSLVALPRGIAALGDSALSGSGLAARILSMLGSATRGVVPATQYVVRLRSTLRRLRPDVVHTNGFKMHMLGLWASGPETPVVWHIHDYVANRQIMAKLMRLHSGRCAAAVTNSDSVSADLRLLCGPGLRIVRIHNAVDVRRFHPRGPIAEFQGRPGSNHFGERVVRVGLVATFARWKGHEVFLRAVSRLPHDCKVHAYVIGGAVYQTAASQRSEAELRELADRLGIGGRVTFTGFLADTPAVMRALDIVVHASTEPEPFGMVLIEAMACGRALVASATGGALEIAQNEENCLLHSPGSVEELASAINRLARSESLRAALGHRGRRTAEERFNSSRLAGDFGAVYSIVTGKVIAQERLGCPSDFTTA